MSETGIVRRMDELGRIVIPKEIRRSLRLAEGEEMEILPDGEKLIVRKHSRFSEAKRAAADVVSDLFSEPVEAIPAATPIVQVEPRVINGGRRLTLVSSPRERMENAPESTSEQPQERFVPDSYQAATH